MNPIRHASKHRKTPAARLRRVVIEHVRPEIDGGHFPIKRTVGELVEVTADIHTDGHDMLGAVALHRAAGETEWRAEEMRHLGNDRWAAQFRISTQEPHLYTVQAWPDAFKSWARDLKKRSGAGQDLSLEFLIGAELASAAAARADEKDAIKLRKLAAMLSEAPGKEEAGKFAIAEGEELATLMARYPDLEAATKYEKELSVTVDRERARYSTWYEMFPRSCTENASRHGTFHDCIKRLDYIAEMGFDVLYLPPIHPIGEKERKGKNNSATPGPDDTGSPWAIGSRLGGHKAIHPQLGTLQDFKELVAKAREKGLEIALDLAFQCAPDHPYVMEHKEWFRMRPDGSVQYAENPPKKYQDIYPLNFESDRARELSEELKSVVLYWIEQGVRIFRVDNPHTKPYAFWEWLIAEVREEYPDILFLSEAFTRPKVMYRLAKLGFTQSYTYFAWRNTKWDLMQYFTELTQTEVREYFRPNLWPNTPDILTEYLQYGGRSAFMIRLCLAATLGANYGIYGPAFELFENRALRPGSEEYLDSEKYQIRVWDINRPDSLKDLIARINRIRRENAALQSDASLRFHEVDNEQLIAYSKMSGDSANIILVVVNLDPHHTQSGWVELPLAQYGLEPHQEYQVHDLVTDARFLWQGPRNYVELNPHVMPAHIFRLRRRVRSEQDFDYFL
jgi:starch synthase (maltosyl-transferring)